MNRSPPLTFRGLEILLFVPAFLSAARGTEGYLLLWLRLPGAFEAGHLNIKVVR